MNIILGGGITALIWAYYNKEHFIVSDQIGGQMSSNFDLGPRYLHNKQPYVTNFLNSLHMSIKHRLIRIGYIDDSGWVSNPDLQFRQNYYMKSRGTTDISGFDNTVLNTNIKEFKVCDVDFKELVFRLFEDVSDRIYSGKVTKIDLQEQTISTDTNLSIKFKNMVSTIPLKIFSSIANLNLDLKSSTMSYCLVSDSFFDLKGFDYVYDARSSTYCHRMTKCKQGIVCDVSDNNIFCFLNAQDGFLPLELKTVKNNQIISLDKDFELEKHPEIKFVGRYGSWHRRWKTETAIEEAQSA